MTRHRWFLPGFVLVLVIYAAWAVLTAPLPYDDGGYCDLANPGVQRPCPTPPSPRR